MQFTKIGILDRLDRLKNSKDGNPRYKVNFDGLDLEATTKADADYCYKICSNWEGKPVQVSFHFTPKGRTVIDDMQLIKQKG